MQSLWIGELSHMQRLSIASFISHGYDYHLYCYKKLNDIPCGCKIMDANEILPEKSIFAYKNTYGAIGASVSVFSNLFRYKLLLERGGWWADMDTICLKPFNFSGDFIAAWQDQAVIGSAIMGAKRNHDLIRILYNEAKKYSGDFNWGTTGPNLVTKIFHKYRFRFWYNIRILKPEVFYPIPYNEWHKILEDVEIPKNSYAVHLWFEMWRRTRTDPNLIPENSLYSKLTKLYEISNAICCNEPH